MATIPMEDLLRLVVDEKASDLHISVGAPPVLRIRGQLVKLEVPALTPEDTETLVRTITKIGRASCRERVFAILCRSRWSPYHSSRRRHTRSEYG